MQNTIVKNEDLGGNMKKGKKKNGGKIKNGEKCLKNATFLVMYSANRLNPPAVGRSPGEKVNLKGGGGGE